MANPMDTLANEFYNEVDNVEKHFKNLFTGVAYHLKAIQSLIDTMYKMTIHRTPPQNRTGDNPLESIC